MSQDLVQWFKDVVNEHEDSYLFEIEDLRKEPIGNWRTLQSLSDLCYAIALKKLVLEKNVIEYKQQLYKSGRYLELFILAEPLNIPEHPRYVKGQKNFRSTADHFGVIYSPLISQNRKLIESFSHLLGWRGEEEDFKVNDLNPEFGHVGFAVKFMVLREDEKAMDHLEILSNMKLHHMLKKDIEQNISVLNGILNQDPARVNNGLEDMLARHKKRRKELDILGKFYAHHVAGLGWLAQERGIKIEIDDELCPHEIFQTHELTYPEVDWIPEDLIGKTWRDFVERKY